MAENLIETRTKSNTNNNKNNDEEIEKIRTELDRNPVEKCSEWLDRCDLNIIDGDDAYSSVSNTDESSSLITETTENSAMDSGFVFHNDGVAMSNEIVASNTDDGVRLDNLISKSNNYKNINVYKSRKVHIGDVNYIYVNQTIEQNQNFTINNNTSYSNLPIITRRNWLAQPPISPPEYLNGPAKYVVIIHSATEEAYTQADNTLLIRLIQTFHIESRKWSDISYNFLIGADGCIFEGRGFGVVGAYAYNYNKISLGLCFIGCYIQHIPPQIALMRAKLLIQHGVEIGAIDKDYRIIGHCQCSSTESPGRRLFEEIKTWDRWDGSVTVNNPSPLLNT